MKAEDIFSKPMTKRQMAVLGRLKATADSDIDYSDIPSLTDDQRDQMVRGQFYRLPKRQKS